MDEKSGHTKGLRWGRADVWGLVAVCAAAALILGKDLDRGALADADAAAHAMDGVLIHDWVMAGPSVWASPMEFARDQYAHYPTLGIGQHYPPGFAIVEAGFFAVFGISTTSARLCVLFFGMLAAAGTYVFVRSFTERTAALLSALTLLAIPATTLWGRQVMLEIPTMAALAWGAVCFAFYVRKPHAGSLTLLLVVTLTAILFKQSGVFLVCAAALAVAGHWIRGVLPFRHAIAVGCVSLAALGLVVFSMDELCRKTVSGYGTYADAWSLPALTYYLRATPYLTGTWILIPAVLGGIVGFRRLGAGQGLLLGWVAAAYIMVTVADLKVPRFFYVGMLPIAVWAGVGLCFVSRYLARLKLATVSFTVFAVVLAGAGFRRPVGDTPDFSPIVEAHREQLRNRPVLFSGLRDGDFVFAVRQHLPRKQGLVVRGSKLLYTCTAGPDLDLVSYTDDEAHLAETMRRLAFEYIFIEREDVVGTPHDQWLRRYLVESGDYRRVADHEFPIEQRSCRMATAVDMYELARPLQRTVEYLDLPIPRTGQSIRVSLGKGSPPVDGPS